MKRKGVKLDKEKLNKIIMLLNIAEPLPLNSLIESIAINIIEDYGLLPNDAIIAATCKYYGISKILTPDSDFEKLDFLTVIRPI